MSRVAVTLAVTIAMLIVSVASAEVLPIVPPEDVGLQAYAPRPGYTFGLGFAVRTSDGLHPWPRGLVRHLVYQALGPRDRRTSVALALHLSAPCRVDQPRFTNPKTVSPSARATCIARS